MHSCCPGTCEQENWRDHTLIWLSPSTPDGTFPRNWGSEHVGCVVFLPEFRFVLEHQLSEHSYIGRLPIIPPTAHGQWLQDSHRWHSCCFLPYISGTIKSDEYSSSTGSDRHVCLCAHRNVCTWTWFLWTWFLLNTIELGSFLFFPSKLHLTQTAWELWEKKAVCVLVPAPVYQLLSLWSCLAACFC